MAQFVHEFLEHSAERLPDKVALICDGQRLTYTQLDVQANRLANALIGFGMKRGDRIALLLPNSIELAISIFAVLKAGGVFVPINPSTKADKCIKILQDCEAYGLITSGRNVALVQQMKQEVSCLNSIILTAPVLGPAPDSCADGFGNIVRYEDLQGSASPQRPPQVNEAHDLACLIYTSGSTGEPKGVMSDHSNMVFVSQSIIEYLGNVESDVILNALPLSFGYGLYQLLMVCCFGGTLVLEKGFTFPAEVLKKMEAEKVTGFPAVPTIYAALLQIDLAVYDLSSLRYLTNAGAALSTSHIAKVRQVLPQAKFFSMYGLTETARTLYLPPEQLDQRPDSVGIAIPGTVVWLEDDAGQRITHAGVVGELVTQGRHVMRGYWNDPEKSKVRFRESFHPEERICYTGDLFRMDEAGFLYFVSRKDDIIKSRGEKVAPKEVENVLYALDGVREAAVIGVPDPILGQVIKAFIVGAISLTELDVQRHCRTYLEDFMIPRYVERVEHLPKTPTGKISKKDLK